jgi:hypothetical protein
MDVFTPRQIALLVFALIVAGALTAWGTTYVLERFVVGDRSDPVNRQGGLLPSQAVSKR